MRNENATVEAKAAQVLANNRTSLITVRQKLATARQAQAAVEDELSPTYGTVRVRQPLPWPAHTIPSSAVCHHIDSRHGSDTVVETVTRSWWLHFCTAISRTHPIQQLPSSHLPGSPGKRELRARSTLYGGCRSECHHSLHLDTVVRVCASITRRAMRLS